MKTLKSGSSPSQSSSSSDVSLTLTREEVEWIIQHLKASQGTIIKMQRKEDQRWEEPINSFLQWQAKNDETIAEKLRQALSIAPPKSSKKKPSESI